MITFPSKITLVETVSLGFTEGYIYIGAATRTREKESTHSYSQLVWMQNSSTESFASISFVILLLGPQHKHLSIMSAVS